MTDITYTLVKRKRSIKFIHSLEQSLKLKKEDKIFHDEDCSNDEINELWINIQYIDSQLHNDHIDRMGSYRQWRRAIDMEVLSYNEALCLLLGIPIEFTDRLLRIDLSNSNIETKIDKCSIEYEFNKTEENRFLFRKYKDSDSINTKEFIEWSIDAKFVEKIIMPSSGIKHRPATIELQKLINHTAGDIINKYPNVTKDWLSIEVSEVLKKKHQISRKPSTIRTKNLKDYPDFH